MQRSEASGQLWAPGGGHMPRAGPVAGVLGLDRVAAGFWLIGVAHDVGRALIELDAYTCAQLPWTTPDPNVTCMQVHVDQLAADVVTSLSTSKHVLCNTSSTGLRRQLMTCISTHLTNRASWHVVRQILAPLLTVRAAGIVSR